MRWNLSMWETCPLLLLLLKLRRSFRTLAESSLMVFLLETGRLVPPPPPAPFLFSYLVSICGIWRSWISNCVVYRMLLVFATRLLSLKTFLVFKMLSRFDFKLLYMCNVCGSQFFNLVWSKSCICCFPCFVWLFHLPMFTSLRMVMHFVLLICFVKHMEPYLWYISSITVNSFNAVCWLVLLFL